MFWEFLDRADTDLTIYKINFPYFSYFTKEEAGQKTVGFSFWPRRTNVLQREN